MSDKKEYPLVIHMDDYDASSGLRYKKFGNHFFKNKKTLVEWLAEQRKYPEAPTEVTHPHLYEKNPTGLSTYMGNPNVKNPHQNMDYSQEQLKEYQKCMEDPIYFCETYVRIMSVDFGMIPFTLYDFQRDMVDSFRGERFNICKLPRQCGKSTTSVAFMLWFILFNPGKTVGILANKGELAAEILGRLQLAYESLPFWLQQGCHKFNQRSMELENKSKIIATSSSGSAARGMSFSLIFLDEFAFVPPNDAEDFFRSVYPTISSGADTKMIVVSTPKGMNHFYKMWMEAKEKRSQFKPTEIHWWDVPGRDEAWKEAQIANTSEDQFRQEFMCEFIGSASTLISPAKLGNLSYINPIRRQEDVDFYEEPKTGHKYFITADCARGLRMDYSAFVVMDVTNQPYKVVAKFRSNAVTPMIFPRFIYNIASYFNQAYVLVEANDVGGQVVESLAYELGYENVMRTKSMGRAGWVLSGDSAASKLGVTTSSSVKTKGCSNLKSLIETDRLIVEDYEIFVELTTFTRKSDNAGSAFAAEPGTNDDLVMCMVLFSWAVMSDYWKEETNIDVAKSVYEEKVEEVEEEDPDSMPLGFARIGNADSFSDSSGDVWTVVEDIDPDDWRSNYINNGW